MILATVAASANAEEYNLYKPERTQAGDIPAPGDGVLTRTIVIRRGDTLSRLSRRYSGRSSFFPQILLFNRIDNPDLIYAGNTLRVPLTSRKGVAARTGEARRKGVKSRGAVTQGYAGETIRRAPTFRRDTDAAGKQLFKRGVTAYARGRYQESIDIFDRYLAAYPNSADAPEAALYKAECYMKLSGR
jgi:TolA-binding protein